MVDLLGLERVERHRLLVRPRRSWVSPFCTRLSGLTSEELDARLSFGETRAVLEQQHRARSRPWASWGDCDRKQFGRQCRAEQLSSPLSRHANVKVVFSRAGRLSKKLGMQEALEHAGLPLEGRHHGGDDDAWNIAALVLRLTEKGSWPN